MQFLLIWLLLTSSTVFSQYNDWGCNHYLTFPVDACVGSSFSAVKWTCNSTDTINHVTYDSYDDCDSDVDATSSIHTSVGSSSECDNADSCDYFKIDCDGYTVTIWLMDVCYSGSSTSASYTCSGSKLTTTSYTSGDCTGSTTSVTFDYDYSVYDGCEVKYLCKD